MAGCNHTSTRAVIKLAHYAEEAALIKALKEREIAVAGFDVLSAELQRINNVIVTPHIGGSTHEAMSRMSETVVENILRIRERKKPLYIVN